MRGLEFSFLTNEKITRSTHSFDIEVTLDKNRSKIFIKMKAFI